MKNSDLVAEFLKQNKIKIAFGIIGSANSHIFDSINALGYTQIVYMHHEQSVVMAMGSYFRASGNLSVALVTAGGGSTNAITGVVSNWADSIPGLIISGQESEKHIEEYKNKRMYGIQGYNSPKMVSDVTKYSKTLKSGDDIQSELEKALSISISGRPGPVWLDFPFDLQSKSTHPRAWHSIKTDKYDCDAYPVLCDTDSTKLVEMLKKKERPVVIAGHGVRLSGAKSNLREFIEKNKIPTVLTWSGIDLLPENHPLNYGRSGVMGERCANFIVQNSDFVIAIGTRLSLLQTGYDRSDFAPNADIFINDVDFSEARKFSSKNPLISTIDCKSLLKSANSIPNTNPEKYSKWHDYCKKIRSKYPKLMPEHKSSDKYINSYEFVDILSDHLADNSIIVTDMGTGLLSGHYSIKLKENQTMFTSLGLGEMGYGLPGAIGASFTDFSRPVVCLNCDGGIMMNLQELQTIKHHNLPIKIVIFNNDGYLMIKHTQKMLFGGKYNGVNADTGLSLPNFENLAKAFDIPYFKVRRPEDCESNLDGFLNTSGPTFCEVFMDPEQDFIPKVRGIKKQDGTIFAPPIEEMSPLLPLEDIKENMIAGVSPKSLVIQR